MSIYISDFRKKLLLIIIFQFIFAAKSFAAIGYEEDTGDMISTIEADSYINIGDDIMYYDFKVKAYRNGFVEFKDNTTSGIKIEIKEIETGKKRIFLLDYE